MKSSELQKNVTDFYLSGLSDSIKREKLIKTSYQKDIDKQIVAEEVKIEEDKKRAKLKRLYKEDVEMGSDDDLENPDDPELENDEEIDPEDQPDALDEADEILAEIDLEEISNGIRLELIEAIIDSAQNALDGGEEDETNDSDFSEFMEKVLELIEGFRYDGEDETGEEGMEMEPEEGMEVEPDLETELEPEQPMV